MRRSISSVLLGLLLAGCGGPPSVAPPSAQETADQTGGTVLDFVERAKKGRAGANDAAILLETLDAKAVDQGGAYETLRDEVRNLKQMYEQKKPKAEIDAQLEKIATAARSLNG